MRERRGRLQWRDYWELGARDPSTIRGRGILRYSMLWRGNRLVSKPDPFVSGGPRPFHPILFAAFPVVAIYSLNLSMVPLGDVWRPLVVSVGATASLWLVLGLALRSARKGALLSSVTLVLFASFGPLSRQVGSLGLVAIDLLVLVA